MLYPHPLVVDFVLNVTLYFSFRVRSASLSSSPSAMYGLISCFPGALWIFPTLISVTGTPPSTSFSASSADLQMMNMTCFGEAL